MSEFLSRTAAQVRSFADDDRGATAIEYSLMASGIALAIISTIWSLGGSIKTNLYDKLAAMF
ncbi:MAG: Flp family type IVb pilin [Pseudolabrys sp.]